eukprot:7323925-Alexandrium_andersonii.AAC.1
MRRQDSNTEGPLHPGDAKDASIARDESKLMSLHLHLAHLAAGRAHLHDLAKPHLASTLPALRTTTRP